MDYQNANIVFSDTVIANYIISGIGFLLAVLIGIILKQQNKVSDEVDKLPNQIKAEMKKEAAEMRDTAITILRTEYTSIEKQFLSAREEQERTLSHINDDISELYKRTNKFADSLARIETRVERLNNDFVKIEKRRDRNDT